MLARHTDAENYLEEQMEWVSEDQKAGNFNKFLKAVLMLTKSASREALGNFQVANGNFQNKWFFPWLISHPFTVRLGIYWCPSHPIDKELDLKVFARPPKSCPGLVGRAATGLDCLLLSQLCKALHTPWCAHTPRIQSFAKWYLLLIYSEKNSLT